MISPDELYAGFGKRVRIARQACAMTQADLARKIGLVRASVANIEVGRQRVTLHTFLDICKAVGLGPAAALGLTASEAVFQSQPPTAAADRTRDMLRDHTRRELERLKL